VDERARDLAAREREPVASALRYSRARTPPRARRRCGPTGGAPSPGSCRGTSRVDPLVRRPPPTRSSSSGLPTSRSAPRRGRRARAPGRARGRRARRRPRATTCRSRAFELDALRGRASSSSQPCFGARCPAVSIAHHWKGVCGLGTCVETLTVTFGPPPVRLPRPSSAFFTACRPRARGRRPRDLAHVLSLLRRQADHEVELHRLDQPREKTRSAVSRAALR
jgi:hypothetical protein